MSRPVTKYVASGSLISLDTKNTIASSNKIIPTNVIEKLIMSVEEKDSSIPIAIPTAQYALSATNKVPLLRKRFQVLLVRI
jgi:hypothetical protein